MRKKTDKRKNRGSSDGNSNTQSKSFKSISGTEEVDVDSVSVSDVLSQTNAVLFDASEDSYVSDKVFDSPSASVNLNNSVVDSSNSCEKGEKADMATAEATSKGEPTNADIMACLRKIDSRLSSVDNRISCMDKRLSALEEVKSKVEGFDKELKRLWTVLEDRNKQNDERMRKIEEKSESQDFACGMLNDKVIELEKEKDALKDEVIYLQSQSMRNNLVFSNIPEAQGESNEQAELKIKEFIFEKMKVAKEVVDKMKFDRVHRMGPHVQGKTRNIVAKFHEYKEKEFVRKQGKALQGTQFHVYEQFPKEVGDRRRKLVPRMQAARRDGKRAWISYDTLYIDGKPVRD